MPIAIGPNIGGATGCDIIASIRDQIPDPVIDPILQDGSAFSSASLIRWFNDAMRIMAITAPIIQDWYGFRSVVGMPNYVLPQNILSVEQLWYDLQPCSRTAELNDIFTTKIQGKSWWFAPHNVHADPVLHVWPAPDRTGSTTTLATAVNTTATSFDVVDATGFKSFGYFRIDDEFMPYYDISGNTISKTIRAQGGTIATIHNVTSPVEENNIFFKCYRLPVPLVHCSDKVEIPQALWPLIELYVLSKVREAEQDASNASKLRQEFNAAMDKLGNRAALRPAKQGIQISVGPRGPQLFGGRVYIP